MAELEVAEKGVSLVHGDIPIRFEKHHGYWATGLHISDDVLREYIEPKMDISRSINNANRDGPEDCDQEANNQSPPGEMSWPGADSRKTHTSHSKEK